MKLKSTKSIIALVVVISVFIVALLNSAITGYSVIDVTGEFPGLGIFLVLLLGAAGLLFVRSLNR